MHKLINLLHIQKVRQSNIFIQHISYTVAVDQQSVLWTNCSFLRARSGNPEKITVTIVLSPTNSFTVFI